MFLLTNALLQPPPQAWASGLLPNWYGLLVDWWKVGGQSRAGERRGWACNWGWIEKQRERDIERHGERDTGREMESDGGGALGDRWGLDGVGRVKSGGDPICRLVCSPPLVPWQQLCQGRRASVNEGRARWDGLASAGKHS